MKTIKHFPDGVLYGWINRNGEIVADPDYFIADKYWHKLVRRQALLNKLFPCPKPWLPYGRVQYG